MQFRPSLPTLESADRSSAVSGLCAPGSPFAALLRKAEAAARRDVPVLLQGESGSGKEVVARYLHQHSARAAAPFAALNCAAIAPGLAESELFGHCRGAFTHAVSDRPGSIRQAQGGTLFLDEIGDTPPALQARLLRVLQEKKVRPVGGDLEVPVDFRLVCATHRNLASEVAAGRFREDLYYRLRVLELRLPPLRDRPMDIPFLLRRFLRDLAGPEAAEIALREVPAEVLRHPFPGNVRELRNLAERYVAMQELSGGWGFLREDALSVPGEGDRAAGAQGLRSSRLNAGDVLSALHACGYHRARAAEKLGVTRRALQYQIARMKKASCPGGSSRPPAQRVARLQCA